MYFIGVYSIISLHGYVISLHKLCIHKRINRMTETTFSKVKSHGL